MAVAVSVTASGSGDLNGVSSRTINGASIGTAASDRIVIFCELISNQDGTGFSTTGVTIGGVTATAITAAVSFQSNVYRIRCWWALVPTGTTANIVSTYSETSSSLPDIYNYVVYRVVGADTTTPISASTTATDTDSSAAASLAIPASGAGIGFSATGGTRTFTWTNLTEDTDFNNASNGETSSSASSTSSGTSTRTATCTGVNQQLGLILFAIQPPTGDTLTNQTLRFM